MLDVHKVSKSFGNTKVLQDVSLKIKKGEFAYVTGPSGSGKTTLMRLILGDLKPDKGHISFDGQVVSEIKKNKLPYYRRKIGTVFQDYKLIPERTVRENIETALAVIGARKDSWAKIVYEVLETVDLVKRSSFFPSQLSGGELQRVALARALAVDPEMILADEPTGNLDWDTAEGVMKLFKQVNETGKTVVISTHHKEFINKFKGHIYKL